MRGSYVDTQRQARCIARNCLGTVCAALKSNTELQDNSPAWDLAQYTSDWLMGWFASPQMPRKSYEAKESNKDDNNPL